MKRKSLIIGVIVLMFSSLANAYVFISATPISVRLIDNGLLLTGAFDMTGIACANVIGPQAVFLPKVGSQLFNQKVSLALTAYATGKKIEVLIADPIDQGCIAVSAIGIVPVVAPYTWTLK